MRWLHLLYHKKPVIKGLPATLLHDKMDMYNKVAGKQ